MMDDLVTGLMGLFALLLLGCVGECAQRVYNAPGWSEAAEFDHYKGIDNGPSMFPE